MAKFWRQWPLVLDGLDRVFVELPPLRRVRAQPCSMPTASRLLEPCNDHIDKATAPTVNCRGSTVSRQRAERECGAEGRGNPASNAAAAPATVSGEPEPQRPLGQPGKAVKGDDPRARRPAVDFERVPGGVPPAPIVLRAAEIRGQFSS